MDRKRKIRISLFKVISSLAFIFLTAFIISFNGDKTIHAAGTKYTVDNNNGSIKWTSSKPSTVNAGDSIEMHGRPEGVFVYLYVDGALKSTAMDGYTPTYTVLNESRVSAELKNSTNDYEIRLTSIYSVVYNNNNGSGNTPTNGTKYAVGESVPLDSGTGLTRYGYAFKGWSISSTATTGSSGNYTIQSSDIINNKITFYAVWECTGHTITYNANGATTGSVPTDTTLYAKDASITVLGNTGSLDKTGCKFSGWNTESNGTGTDYAAGSTYTMGNDNVTLYAKWVDAYTITYDGNATGSSYTVSNMPTDNSKYVCGEVVTLSATTPTRNGYEFLGWSETQSGTTITSYTMQASNITIFARWKATNYTITYECNGGVNDSNNPVSYNADSFQSSSLSFSNPTRAGYTFAGWYAESNFSGSSVTGYAPSDAKYGNITLYAKWNANQYSITYSKDYGKTNEYLKPTYTPDDNTYTLPALTKNGYIFNGWYDNSNFTGSAITEITKGSYGDKSFYAKFTAISHVCDNVTYNIPISTDTIGLYKQATITSGNYYLYEDVQLDDNSYIGEDAVVNICLNGHTLSLYEGFTVKNNAKLTITDCGTTGKIISANDMSSSYMFSTLKSNITFNNIEIIALTCDVVVIDDSNDGVITFNKCHVQSEKRLAGPNGFSINNWTVNIIGKDSKAIGEYDIEKITTNNNTNFIINLDSGVVNITNANFYVKKGGAIRIEEGELYFDEDSTIEMNCLSNAIKLTEDVEAYIEGKVFVTNGYVASTNELDGSTNTKALICIENDSDVHLYSSTVLTPYTGTVAIYCEPWFNVNHYSCIYVEEALTNAQPIVVYSGTDAVDDTILVEEDLIYGFLTNNPGEDVSDYFTLIYSPEDETAFFFTVDEDNDIIKTTKFKITSQPDNISKSIETNNDDATYQWYSVEANKDRKILPSELNNVPAGVSTDSNNNFIFNNSFDAVFKNTMPTFSKFGAYLVAGTYTLNNLKGDFHSIGEDCTSIGTFKVKLYMTRDGGTEFEVTDEYIDMTAGEFAGIYNNGYWSASGTEALPNSGIYSYSFRLTFDRTNLDSPFYNMGSSETYTMRMVFEEDTPWYVYTGSYASMVSFDSLEMFNGAKFYFAFDSLTMNGAISGETTSTLVDPKAGQYICATTLDGKTLYSDVLTIDYIDVSIAETAQTYTYDTQSKAFEIKGTHKDLGSYVIKYASHSDNHNNGDWSTTAPINAGSYDVMITRAIDDYYAAYSKEIKNGLVINKATQSITNISDISKSLDANPASIPTYTKLGDGIVTIEYKLSSANDSAYTTVAPINKGMYVVRVSVAEGSNYLAGSATKDFTIGYTKIVEPTADSTVFTYNGNDQTYTLATNPNYTITGDLTKKNAGKTTITVTINDKNNYCWSDYSDTDLTFDFIIEKAPVSEPTVNGTYTYNGSEQTLVLNGLESYMSTVDSIKETDANTYTITYTLDDNHTWSNDSDGVISWTINPKEVEISWTEKNYVYNDKVQAIIASYKDANNQKVILKVITDKEFKNAGTYTATATFANNETNYKLPSECTKQYTIITNPIKINDKAVEEAKKPESGTQAEIIAGSLDISALVVIEKDDSLLASTVTQSIKEEVSKKSEIVAKFEIHLEDQNGIKIENIDGNKYKITITIPAEIQGRSGYAIVYVKDDGTVEKYNSIITDTTITFETTHFSNWAIVADGSTFPIWLIILITSLIISTGVLYYCLEIKKTKELEY